MSRYDLIGYCSYRDNETGFVADDFVNVLNKQDEKIKELEKQLEKCVKVTKEQIDKTFNAECELSIVKTNQNQLAIEELEKVYAKYYETGDDILGFIDQRINELRGEK